MAVDNFDQSLAAVLKDEGQNDDDPLDHGGRTSRGITQHEYDGFQTVHGNPLGDVWLATDAEIRWIYHDNYWEPWCNQLPRGIDYLFFDMRVNAGTHRAVILLQHILKVAEDGKIGPVTLGEIAKTDSLTLISRYSDAKRAFYRSLNQPHFLNGWLNRCNSVQSVAAAMVNKQGV